MSDFDRAVRMIVSDIQGCDFNRPSQFTLPCRPLPQAERRIRLDRASTMVPHACMWPNQISFPYLNLSLGLASADGSLRLQLQRFNATNRENSARSVAPGRFAAIMGAILGAIPTWRSIPSRPQASCR